MDINDTCIVAVEVTITVAVPCKVTAKHGNGYEGIVTGGLDLETVNVLEEIRNAVPQYDVWFDESEVLCTK